MKTKDANALRSLVITNAYRLYLSTLHGCQAPSTHKLFEELTNPKVGDLVIETSTIHDESRDEARFGRLLKVAYEPIEPVDEFEGQTERVHYLQLGDGRKYRWRNAGFIKVVERREIG